MARRKKTNYGYGQSGGWLVTFSDLTTLLLTFFVLLISMASMDKTLLTRIMASTSDPSPISPAGRGRVPDRIQLILEMVQDPLTVQDKADRIKDLLFPDEILPPELSRGSLDNNLRILSHPEGVVLVLNEGILFPATQSELTESGLKLLDALLPFLLYCNADVNISGHTDMSENATAMENYRLSGKRAMAILEYLLQNNLPAARFSISGYAGEKPLDTDNTPENRKKNRRVELLVKTTQWLGRYL